MAMAMAKAMALAMVKRILCHARATNSRCDEP
jgi:hypothetical protein